MYPHLYSTDRALFTTAIVYTKVTEAYSHVDLHIKFVASSRMRISALLNTHVATEAGQ